MQKRNDGNLVRRRVVGCVLLTVGAIVGVALLCGWHTFQWDDLEPESADALQQQAILPCFILLAIGVVLVAPPRLAADSPTCSECGYSLVGLRAGGVCPECGEGGGTK